MTNKITSEPPPATPGVSLRGVVTHHPRWAALVLGVPLLVVAFSHAGDFLTYSDGSLVGRTGVVTKFSHKGGGLTTLYLPLCKSWEGELTVNNVSAPFQFSVLSNEVRDKVIEAARSHQPVSLRYQQTFSHWSCNRDTDYVILDVVPLAPTRAPDRPVDQPAQQQ